MRKLAAGGVVIWQCSCSSKELCEFRHSENLTLLNASEIEDVAYKTGTAALARPYRTLRNRSLHMVNRSISNLLFVSTPCDWLLYYAVHCSTPSSTSSSRLVSLATSSLRLSISFRCWASKWAFFSSFSICLFFL